MTTINEDSALSDVFTLARSAILANTTLAKRFNATNIYQFEPKHKSADFKGFPYIWVNVPSMPQNKETINNSVRLHPMSVDLYLRMEYGAPAETHYVSYCTAILTAIRAYEDNFKAKGYYDLKVELVDTDPHQIFNQKDIVEGTFMIDFHGQTEGS